MKFFLEKEDLTRTCRSWLPLGFVITMFFLGMAGVAQQIIRQGANDPQIQITEDMTADLINGTPVLDSANRKPINIADSLSSFTATFDQDGNIISSDYVLNDKEVFPPKGVFDYARTHGEDRVTWQPEKGVRTAIVVKYYKSENRSGYVLAGRSMKETEKRTGLIYNLLLIGWLVTTAGSYKVSFLFRDKRRED